MPKNPERNLEIFTIDRKQSAEFLNETEVNTGEAKDICLKRRFRQVD